MALDQRNTFSIFNFYVEALNCGNAETVKPSTPQSYPFLITESTPPASSNLMHLIIFDNTYTHFRSAIARSERGWE